MGESEVLNIGRHCLIVTLQLALPILLFGLVAGVLVSIFQAVTSIQEFTLERAECLAHCDAAPVVQVDHDTMHGPVTPDAAVALLARLRPDGAARSEEEVR